MADDQPTCSPRLTRANLPKRFVDAEGAGFSSGHSEELYSLVAEIYTAEKIAIVDRDAWGLIITGQWIERAKFALGVE